MAPWLHREPDVSNQGGKRLCKDQGNFPIANPFHWKRFQKLPDFCIETHEAAATFSFLAAFFFGAFLFRPASKDFAAAWDDAGAELVATCF